MKSDIKQCLFGRTEAATKEVKLQLPLMHFHTHKSQIHTQLSLLVMLLNVFQYSFYYFDVCEKSLINNLYLLLTM